jgi:hypothetical protein
MTICNLKIAKINPNFPNGMMDMGVMPQRFNKYIVTMEARNLDAFTTMEGVCTVHPLVTFYNCRNEEKKNTHTHTHTHTHTQSPFEVVMVLRVVTWAWGSSFLI